MVPIFQKYNEILIISYQENIKNESPLGTSSDQFEDHQNLITKILLSIYLSVQISRVPSNLFVGTIYDISRGWNDQFIVDDSAILFYQERVLY